MKLNLSKITADLASLHGLIVDSEARSVAMEAELVTLKAAAAASDIMAVQASIDALDGIVKTDIAALTPAATSPAPVAAPAPVAPAPALPGQPTGVEVPLAAPDRPAA